MTNGDHAFTLGLVFLHLVTLYYYWSLVVVMWLIYAAYNIYMQTKKEFLDIKGKGVLVTGCDTGFGYDAVKKLDDLGFTVYAGVLQSDSKGADDLRDRKSGRVHVMQLDVTDQNSVNGVIECIKENGSDLWGVVNNAGINYPGDIELVTIEQFKKVAEVNIYGMLRVIKASLPLIRASKGRIVNVTSVKGRYALPGDGPYIMTKHAAETMSDSLRMEMKRFGVNVSVIEPGNFVAATGIANSKNVERIQGEFDSMWSSATDEVKSAYGGLDYLKAKKDGQVFGGTKGCTTIKMIDAIVDALSNVSPRHRYRMAGSGLMVDKHLVMSQLYDYTPSFISDFIICYLMGYPQEEIPNKGQQQTGTKKEN